MEESKKLEIISEMEVERLLKELEEEEMDLSKKEEEKNVVDEVLEL